MVPKVTPSCHFVALSAQTPRLAWLGYQGDEVVFFHINHGVVIFPQNGGKIVLIPPFWGIKIII